jgi:Flp pilus assembly pilin Flp
VIEYSFLIVCIIVALVAMQSYIKRGIQGKLRQSADQIGTQYEPGQTSSDFTITSRSNITSVSILEKIDEDTINTTTVVTTNYDTQERTGTETVGAF